MSAARKWTVQGVMHCPSCDKDGLGSPHNVRRDLGPRGLGEWITGVYQECRYCRVLVPVDANGGSNG